VRVVTVMDYYKFCERYRQRCATRRAELEEDEAVLRRSAEFRQWSSEALRQRSGGGDLIYKTVYNVTSTQQQSGGMDAATNEAWNSWVDHKIAKAIHEDIEPVIVKALEALVDQANLAMDDLEKALTRERERTDKLRGELEVLRIMVRSQSIGVTRSKRDVV
jgi:hypothetical protein